jgi:hypothetical protein
VNLGGGQIVAGWAPPAEVTVTIMLMRIFLVRPGFMVTPVLGERRLGCGQVHTAGLGMEDQWVRKHRAIGSPMPGCVAWLRGRCRSTCFGRSTRCTAPGTLTAAAGVAAGVVVRCRLGLADDSPALGRTADQRSHRCARWTGFTIDQSFEYLCASGIP